MEEALDDSIATFWDHLDELRSTLLRVFFVIIAGLILTLIFYSPIVNLLISPLQTEPVNLERFSVNHQKILNSSTHPQIYTLSKDQQFLGSSDEVQEISPLTYSLPPNSSLEYTISQKSLPLALLSPLEGMKTTLKISFWLSLVGTSPIWLYFIVQFIAPAVDDSYRKLIFPFLGLSLLFMGAGFLFAQTVTLPLANEFLYAFNEEIGTNLWSYASYIDYTLLLLLANGLAFELTLLLFFLVHFGLLTPEFMRSKRRLMILTAFVLGAILTPPDVFTQILLAFPLIGLYELAILYAKFRK